MIVLVSITIGIAATIWARFRLSYYCGYRDHQTLRECRNINCVQHSWTNEEWLYKYGKM